MVYFEDDSYRDSYKRGRRGKDSGVTFHRLLTLVLFLVGFVLLVVSFASPYWIDFDETNIKLNQGLWRTCAKVTVSGTTTDTCANIGNTEKDWFEIVRAMMCLALVCGGITLIGYLVHYRNYFRYAPAVVVASQGLAALFLIIAVAVYGAKFEELVNNVSGLDLAELLGWAIWLAVAAAGLFLLHVLLYLAVNNCMMTLYDDYDDEYDIDEYDIEPRRSSVRRSVRAPRSYPNYRSDRQPRSHEYMPRSYDNPQMVMPPHRSIDRVYRPNRPMIAPAPPPPTRRQPMMLPHVRAQPMMNGNYFHYY